MNLDAASRTERQLNRRKAAWLAGIACVTFIGIVFAQLSRYVIGGKGSLNVGDVAPRDIRVPQRTSFISDYETKRLRDLSEASIGSIFTLPDSQISRRQLSTARAFLDGVALARADRQTATAERIKKIVASVEVGISEQTALKLLELSQPAWLRVDMQVMSVLDVALRSPIQPDNLNRAKDSIASLISLSLSQEEAAAVNEVSQALLVPNTNYDATATDLARLQAREAVLPVERSFEANQTLIRSGQVLKEIDVEALEKLNLRRPDLAWPDLAGAALFSLLAVSLIAAGMIYGHGNVFTRPVRNTALSMGLLVLALSLTRWLLPGHGLLPYLAPVVAVTLAITIWSGTFPGLLSGLVLGVLVGLDLDKPLEFVTYFACGSVMACLALGRAERLSSFARAGIAAGVMQALIILAFNLPAMQAQDAPQLASYLIASITSGVLAAALALTLLYFSGWVLDITTIIQLIELSRPSHPLLQQMLLQAPGTYHHSLMVANLSEQAAERIGADSLLTRVGAYYHDIGKMANPHFFIENQLQGLNVHDQLDPATSAAILRSHVSDGLKLARQYRLPSRIQAFIAEHHGKTKMKYQLALATQGSTEPPDLSQFTYPGPRPQSKETALVMLADGCEAIVRAQRPANLEAMEAALREILTDRLADHQLDDSNLTLRDLDMVRQSFLDSLRGAYHPRIQYPQVKRNQDVPAPEALPESSGTAISGQGAIEQPVGTI